MLVIIVSDKDKSKSNDSVVEDPFEELNEIEDKTVTIERENDVFEELEIRDAESIPEYNSESGSFIKTDEGLEKYVNEDKSDLTDNKDNTSSESQQSENKVQIMDVIEEVDVNNPNNNDKIDTKRIVHESIKSSMESERIAKKSEALTQKTEKLSKINDKLTDEVKDNVKQSENKKSKKIRVKPKRFNKSKTNVVDNVKVDEDGVPLLNQFDKKMITNNSLYHKFSISKKNLSQIVLILVGFIIIIFGIIQANQEVMKISDSVMYGEHASMSILIIFIGVLVIILAFYKELINLLGLGSMYNTLDSDEFENMKKNNKK